MNDSAFLPEGYEPPKATGRYTRFEDGKTIRIRILGATIIGWEYWDKKQNGTNKPVRLPYTEENRIKAVNEANKNTKQDDKKVNHFWAMKVWNYETKQIEICQITQKTIMSSIRNYLLDEDYGSPEKYDIKITKKKDGDKTTYEVTPGVPRPISDEVQEEVENTKIQLKALFFQADPFDKDWREPTANFEDDNEEEVQEPVKKSKPKPKEEDIAIEDIPF